VLPEVNDYHDPASMPPGDVAIVALKTTQNFQLPELLPEISSGGAAPCMEMLYQQLCFLEAANQNSL